MALTEEETLNFADRQLGQNLRDLPFTLTYLLDENGDARLAGSSGIAAGHPAAPALLAAGDAAVWPVDALERGETALVELRSGVLSELPTGDWRDPPTQALVVPLLRQGGAPSGFLVAALNRYRPLDEAYRGFVTLVAGHIASGIGSARSYRAQQRRAEELAELDRAKTTFFSNISHEFRTPLTLILDPVDQLRGRDRARRSDASGTGYRLAQRITSDQARQHTAGFLAHRGRPHTGELCAGRPGRGHRRACQRVPVGGRTARA